MEPASAKRLGRAWVAILVLVWLAVVLGGAALLQEYKATPGIAAAAPGTWPAASRIRREATRPTLVMLAHPRCACTRASIAELRRLLSTAGDVAAHVVFVRPEGMPADWERSGTWASASEIRGVRVWADPNGVEAERFGGVTSGTVLLYDRAGALRFSGGITPARGHQGDSAGRRALLAALRNTQTPRAQSAVFGCPIF